MICLKIGFDIKNIKVAPLCSIFKWDRKICIPHKNYEELVDVYCITTISQPIQNIYTQIPVTLLIKHPACFFVSSLINCTLKMLLYQRKELVLVKS